MKKVLLASSALVAGAAFTAPAMADGITWSAFSQFFASSSEADEDSAGRNDVRSDNGIDFLTNTEVALTASMTADNGLTYGMHLQLEGDQGAGGSVDENHIFLKGDFGEVQLGNQDGAGDALMVSASSVGFTYGMNTNFTGSSVTSGGASVAARTGADYSDTSDATKITYFTPSFNGFKAGISYTPDVDGGAGAPFGNGLHTGGNDDKGDNQIDVGLNYSGSYNDVSVKAAIVGGTRDNGIVGTDDETRYNAIGGGLKIGVAGFSVAAGYMFEDEEEVAETNTFDVGVGFATGPWNFTAGYVWSEYEEEATGGDSFENDSVSAGVTYNIAPGLTATLGGAVGEFEAATNEVGEFSTVVGGILVSF